MRSFFKLFFLIIIVLGLGCTSTEKIGNVTYKTKINKVFIDDYNGMVLSIKLYYFKNEFQAGCTIKGQKLGFENLSDTVFIYGTTTIDSEQKELICKEFYSNGYQTFINKDSLVKIFKQQHDGKMNLIEYKR